jgi:S-adenosyl methyltransferase
MDHFELCTFQDHVLYGLRRDRYTFRVGGVTVSEANLGAGREQWPEIDTSVAHVARVYDYLLGGKANFAVDREAAERAYAAWPGGLGGVRADARAHRALLGRVIRYLAAEEGIRQFLDIGTGIPREDNVHEVAQRVASDARIVYVDYDPIVLAHAHRLLTSTPEGACAYIRGDLREPTQILREATSTLDIGQPVAILLFGILHFFASTRDIKAILTVLTQAVVPGSYLAITHLAKDVDGEALTETFARLNEQMSENVTLRTRSEVEGLFTGMEIIPPGVVQLPQWRPDDPADADRPARPLPMWCGVGCKL